MTNPGPGFAEELPVGACRLDSRQFIVDANTAFSNLHGLARDDCTNRPVSEMLSQPFVDNVLRIVRAAEVERRSASCLCSQPAATGVARQIKYVASPFGRSEVVLTAVDLTEDLAELETLRSGLRRFECFLDQSPFIAWIRDAKERYVYLNETYRSHYELTPSDRIGRTPFDVWPSETAWQFHRNDMRVLASGTSRTFVEMVPDPDGTMRTWFNVKFPVEVDDGSRLIAGVGLDITSHEESHERLIAERLQVERKQVEEEAKLIHLQQLQSLALLVSGAAHDINNMLAAVHVYAGLLRSRHSGDVDSVDCVDRIVEAADAALRLSRQMLGLYRRNGIPTRKSLDLSTQIHEFQATLEAIVRPPHRLRFDLAKDLPPIRGDAVQIRQVVMNLVVNAVEAMGSTPGVITVSTRLIPAERGSTELIECSVVDTGPGIPPDVLPKVFDPFFTTKSAGSGLGLAAVRAILNAHDGTVALDSVPGQGTTARVVFPASEQVEG